MGSRENGEQGEAASQKSKLHPLGGSLPFFTHLPCYAGTRLISEERMTFLTQSQALKQLAALGQVYTQDSTSKR